MNGRLGRGAASASDRQIHRVLLASLWPTAVTAVLGLDMQGLLAAAAHSFDT